MRINMLFIVVLVVALKSTTSAISEGGDESLVGKGCPKGATGLYPYAFDCKRFFNCYKGRGSLTSCAPGTLFNPKTLQCDFPAKVECYSAPENRVGRIARYEEYRNDPSSSQGYHAQREQGTFNGPQRQAGYPVGEGQQVVDSDNAPYSPQQGYSSLGSHSFPVHHHHSHHHHSHHHDLGPHHGVQPPHHISGHSQGGDPSYGSLNKNVDYERTSAGSHVKFSESHLQSLGSPAVKGGHQYGAPSQSYNSNSRSYDTSSTQFASSWNQNYVGRNSNNVKFPPPPPPPPYSGNVNGSWPRLFYPDPAQQVPPLFYQGPLPNSYPSPGNQNSYQGYPNLNQNSQTPSQNPYSGTPNQNAFHDPSGQNPPFVFPNQKQPSGTPNLANYPQDPQRTYQEIPNQRPYQNPSYQEAPNQSPYQGTSNPSSNQKQFSVPPNYQDPNTYPERQPSQNLPYPSMFNGNHPPPAVVQPSPNAPGSFNTFIPPDNRGTYNPQQNPLRSKTFEQQPNGYGEFDPTNRYPPAKQNLFEGTTITSNRTNDHPSSVQTKVLVYTECPSEYSGLLPHTSCSKFLSCAHGRTYVMDCGPGTRFHPEYLICAHPHQVTCASLGDESFLVAETKNNGQVAIPAPACTNNEFLCDKEKCISKSYVCNGVANCLDGTDEINCATFFGNKQITTSTTALPQPSCSATEFSCDAWKCFHESRLCDGIADCEDKTDEANCPSFGKRPIEHTTTVRPTQPNQPKPSYPSSSQPLCLSTEFSCDAYRCFHESKLCDGFFDCQDRTDEANCPGFANRRPTIPTTVSPTQPTRRKLPANGYPSSSQPTCSSTEFSCDVNKCLHESRLCDGFFDCQDRSDETDCPSFDIGNPERISDLDVRFGQNNDHDAEIMSTLPSPSYRSHPANKSVRGFFIKPTEPSVVKSVTIKTVTTSTTTQAPSLIFAETIKPINAPTRLSQHDRQVVRLRGGPSQMEGYVELRFTKGTWGAVCDQNGQWTLEEANLVCQNLGYMRGAEISWQGKPASANISITKSDVLIDTVRCSGSEDSIAECFLSKGSNCNVDRDVAWVRCMGNAKSLCHPGEIALNDKCYHLVIPSEEDVQSDLAGFNQGEAMSHCQKLGGHLIGIQSQIESDYVSEWLLRFKEVDTVMTSGVGVSVYGMPIWIWEGSEEPFSYQNWWPGWRGVTAPPPQTAAGRASCIVLRRFFPCPDSKGNPEGRLCDSQYFFWDTEDCGTMSSKLPYVCKRPANKIGCIMGSGINYRGGANVTGQGNLCVPWDKPDVASYLKYKISDDDRVLTLAGHNYCRNVGGSDTEPWCFIYTAQGLQKEYCDIPHCSKGVERSAKYLEYKCSSKMFSCEYEKECIPKDWVCDGKADCTNGLDENNCKDEPLDKFNRFPQSKLVENKFVVKANVSISTCAERCLDDENCRSFSYNENEKVCRLSESNVGLSGNLMSGEPDWSYNERTSKSLRCNGLFVCDNGKCLSSSSLCNGRDECGDKSDEKNCSWLEQGIQLRLVGSRSKNEGTIEVKALGGWGLICDDQFDMNDAHVVCRHLGFPLGAKELRNSSSPMANGTSNFLIDDLHCTGTESTIADCAHNGWGVHDCNQEEAAGVVCKVVENECSLNYWQCRGVAECVPIGFLCDNVPDCHDKSDEDPANCNSTFSVRLVGTGGESRSNKVTEGRVEVKRFGVWGTVCDDDFGEKEADVICNSLGFKGPAKAYKEAAFGAGTGVIWMDQVHCFGNETNVSQCMHDSWGQTNCNHDEDVAVACSPQRLNMDPAQSLDIEEVTVHSIKATTLDDVLPKACGRATSNLPARYVAPSVVMQRVVSGFETSRGSYPWQASVRVRSISGKNTHWCGATIITSRHILTAGHCLRDYVKTAYAVRAGDFDSESFEGSEQDLEVEQIWIHPKLDEETKLNNDIGIVKVKSPGFVFNDWVKPACLPNENSNYKAGRNCTISGWGSNTPGSGFVRTLHASWLPILPLNECRDKSIYGSKAITSGMFCAGSLKGGPDSCQGDSGGPFMCSEQGDVMTVYGITSWGLGCGRHKSPGVYTNVARYLPWIRETITK